MNFPEQGILEFIEVVTSVHLNLFFSVQRAGEKSNESIILRKPAVRFLGRSSVSAFCLP